MERDARASASLETWAGPTERIGRIVGAVMLALLATGAEAVELELVRDDTSISFELDSTLHRVSGVATLDEGNIHFDPTGGAASGRIVIDATSLDTGNGLRDAQMHRKVLESQRFPRIEFLPSTLLVESREASRAEVALIGTLLIHGGEWPIRIPASVTLEKERARIAGSFAIPYVEWGMRDMSNFLLHVDPAVTVRFEATARITSRVASSEGDITRTER